MKKSRNDAVKTAVTSYLVRRNYPDVEFINNSANLSHSAEQMAVSNIVQCEASRANSILFSCINNDPAQYDTQYNRLVTFVKEVKSETIKNELLGLLSPLLCHLYLDMLRGGHSTAAQVFLKKHSTTLQKDTSYHQPVDGNLPSALYRPNSLEQLFNSLQNGTIDNDAPEKDFMNQILDDIGSIYNLQEVETKPSISAFRSCKYDLSLSQDALNVLKSYLAKHGHVLLMQVLQTWFHVEINGDDSTKNDADEDEGLNDERNSLKRILAEERIADTNDIFAKCNGHAEYQTIDKELRDLQEAIRNVRESVAPIKLYKVVAPDTHLICAKTDNNCNILCAGFSNNEIRLWDLGQNNVKMQVNRNISVIELACNMLPEPEYSCNNPLQLGDGLPLRGHSGSIEALHVLGKENLILSASHDNTMRAWRLSDYSCASIYRGHNYPIWCMDVSRNGLFIVTGSHDKTAKLWSLDRTFPVRIFVGHISDVTCVKFHPNEAYIATGGADRSVRLWTVCDARLVRVLGGQRGIVRALAFSPSGSYLASAGDDKKIKVWDLAAGTCIHEYRGHHGKVVALDWSSVGRSSLTCRNIDPNASPSENSLLCSASMDATVRIWDNQNKTKSTSNQDAISSTYNTKCSYLVNVQVHPDWVVAIGTKR